MTKPREKTREEVTAEIEDGKKKIRQLENRERCCGKLYALSTAVGVFCHMQRLFL